MVSSCLCCCCSPWNLHPLFLSTDKSSAFKLKFRHGHSYYKRIPEAGILAHTNKWNLAWVTFGKLPRLFSGKWNLLYLSRSMPQRQGYVYPIKQKVCAMKNFPFFPKTLISMTQISIYQFSLVELIKNCI